MNYLYKLVTTENVEINYDTFKKKELIECLVTMRDIYFSLKQENKQLKDDWNYIKKMLKEARQEEFNINGYCGTCTDVDIDFLLNKMQELEQGSDNQ